METDGRIRSKDIGTGEVNSRALDNIRSSNYDGSHTNPEVDPGENGWQILKNGFVVINDAVVRGTISAARIISAVLESGSLNIRSGGKLTVGDEEDPLVTLDEDGLTVGDAPVVIDSTGLDVGGGLVTVDSTGLQVGTDVVIDSTGLHVDGGDVRAVDVAGSESQANSQTLTTTLVEKTFHTIAVPSWATSAIVQNISLVQSNNGGFGTLGVLCSARVDSVNDGAAQSDTAGLTTQAFHATTKVLSSLGATIRISCFAGRNGGSGDPTNAACVARSLVIFLR